MSLRTIVNLLSFIVATIHQPSYTILSQFDNLLLLAQGKVCYFGKVVDAIPYFERLGIPISGNPGMLCVAIVFCVGDVF